MTGQAVLELINAQKHFSLPAKRPFGPRSSISAVDGVSLSVQPGQTFSLVGESGCGKTTTARMVLLLENLTDGAILFEGENINSFTRSDLASYRKGVQAVFQDPWGSMNPRMRVGETIAEPLALNTSLTRQERQDRVAELLVAVGLSPSVADNFPHEFSGGQRQRVAMARALALKPKVIVLDEPVSALDVSVSAQIMNLLKDLQEEVGVSYLLIAHNLASVRYLSHRVGVMYLGQIVEEAESEVLFTSPQHPYTKALISAALPLRRNEQDQAIVLSGEVPSPSNPPSGCRFHTRCAYAMPHCATEVPRTQEIAPGHKVACHLYG